MDVDRFVAFCRAHPADGTCGPQQEFPLSLDDGLKALEAPDLAAELIHARDDHTIPEVRAAFLIAPAIVQAFTPDSLARLRLPVAVVLGDADAVIPAHTNGGLVARAIPGAELKVLSGVGHYDFLSACTQAAMDTISLCDRLRVSQGGTHQAALQMAYGFFSKTLGLP